MRYITTPQLLDSLNDPNTTIIDVRPVDAYNGWTLRNEPRGGHIQRARSLPLKWTNYIDWPDIVNAKGIRTDNDLILYGYDDDSAEKARRHFERAGYESVSIYRDFLSEWSSDSGLPMDALPRYRHLVPATWLAELLHTGHTPEYDHKRHVLCHAHYQNPAAYTEGHIPGAIPLDTNSLESPETWNRRSSEELQHALQQAGITRDTTVILYGRYAHPNNDDPFPGSSAGHLGAIRCAMIMLYAGVQDVRVLNGGLQAWLDAGYTTTTESTNPAPVAEFGATIPGRPELFVDLPDAKRILADPDANLVSVRSWREFIGQVSGYNYIEKKGRITGAIFGNCGSDAYHMENYRNVDHTTREYHEIEAAWTEAGITRDNHNAFYCGTGWRGSEACFNAWLMAWPRVSVYDGGWFEWSSNDNNPTETGTPQTQNVHQAI